MAKAPTSIPANSPLPKHTDEELEKVIDRQIGDLVPQKQREVIVARMTSLIVSEHFSGPLPHPKHLVGYEQISPGAADRIIAMAERQQTHHIEMDKKIVDA